MNAPAGLSLTLYCAWQQALLVATATILFVLVSKPTRTKDFVPRSGGSQATHTGLHVWHGPRGTEQSH